MIRFTRLTLCSGQTGTFMMIVEQLGLAMRPLCLWIWSGLTSGTTSGTPSFIRKALVLSTTTAPAWTAAGANSLLTEPPAEKNAICTPLKLSFVNSSIVCVFPWNVIDLPALRALARNLMLLMGKLRSARTVRNSCPTAPVAPAIATLTDMTSSRFCKKSQKENRAREERLACATRVVSTPCEGGQQHYGF